MFSKNKQFISRIAAIGVVAQIALTAMPALAAPVTGESLPPAQETQGEWTVSRLALENGQQIESFKVARDFAAWTMIDEDGRTRRLYAFDGARTTEVAVMDRGLWDQDNDNGFFDAVEGNYDLNDGLLVWTASDGLDREIWSFDGFTVRQVSNNTYDDRHPVTAAGRIVWTSQPGSVYNLMAKDQNGLYRVDSWHVTNYVLSGKNLFWLNRLPNENWFRVFRNDGMSTEAVGKADDRTIADYFYSDGQGSVAWEYSTKQWDYDKRVIYLSRNGRTAVQVLQRDVPPNVMRIEDVVDGWVVVNVTDLLQSAIWNRVQLLASNGYQTEYLDRFLTPIKVQALSKDQVVRHLVPDTASALIESDGGHNENFIRNEHVVHDLFVADDGLLAAALLDGGILTMKNDQVSTIASPATATELQVNEGCVAWVEGPAATSELKFACPNVAVKAGSQVSRLAGRLVKSPESPAVYLAAADGLRYSISTESEFYGWYQDFASLRTIPATELAAMHLGGTVLLKPNYRPVKLANSPRVYTVSADGELRWVTNGQTMTDLYGADWNRLVVTVPDYTWPNYRLGQPVNQYWEAPTAIALAY
jgi:hypothetical protein